MNIAPVSVHCYSAPQKPRYDDIPKEPANQATVPTRPENIDPIVQQLPQPMIAPTLSFASTVSKATATAASGLKSPPIGNNIGTKLCRTNKQSRLYFYTMLNKFQTN